MGKRKESQTAKKCSSGPTINGDALRKAVGWIADAGVFDNLQRHGNTGWQAPDLIMLAVLWVWSDNRKLTGAFEEAHHWSLKVLGRAALSTYQGLLGALVTWTETLLPLLWQRLQTLMQQHGQAQWRVGSFVPLAIDGSRISTPRTQENEQAFCAPHFGKSLTAKYRNRKTKNKRRRKTKQERMNPIRPQMWLTLIWHMGLQMPWSWRKGPSHASEREHFGQMLAEQTFPENTLFCGDAGFTGYELWKQMLDGGHDFVIRVGANVRLLRKLGYARERDGIVYLWPDRIARKRQPPLVLRLMPFQLGKGKVYLITSVLEKKRLSERQALTLYRRRWGVELQFRTLKQTFGRRKLRSRTPVRAAVELDWSLLGLWMIQLFAVKEQGKIGDAPENCSVALAIDVVRRIYQRWSEHPNSDESLAAQLRLARKDDCQRTSSKHARYRPNFKDKPSAGKPQITTANRKRKDLLRAYLATAS